MSQEPETPFDNIESGLEYVNHLLEATEEAQKQIETEIERTKEAGPATRKAQIGHPGLARRQKPRHSERSSDTAALIIGRAEGTKRPSCGNTA